MKNITIHSAVLTFDLLSYMTFSSQAGTFETPSSVAATDSKHLKTKQENTALTKAHHHYVEHQRKDEKSSFSRCNTHGHCWWGRPGAGTNGHRKERH